ncbi:putative quinol monooxygenase [Sphingobium ummariense]|uniref:ABM domain-containing protein n=1 Tax=Sphingobium ummariense RL-3 TaxID=1346791 RepID=T0KHS6_9SPHN|nr:putative quinol monooxygenase [Sphingobium ummariense]EQB32893.1 hypothetical protein M529_07590 [Sphingobium ummariense RL-3]
MLLIAGTFRLPPENMPAARAPMRVMIEASRAEEGCHAYAFAEDVLDPGLIHVAERWESQAALDAHFATDHMAAWRDAGVALGIGERDLWIYQGGESRPL